MVPRVLAILQLTKDAVNAVCANVDYKSYTLELIEVTAANKDGPAQCEQFAEMIDRVEKEYGCKVIYFTTDADGGSNKGRKLLGKKRHWLILPSCWAHQFQLILGDYFKVNPYAAEIAESATYLIGWLNNHGKVQKIFDAAQAQVSKDRLQGRIVVLAYLVANLTRWTTHCVAFLQLESVKLALQLAVMQSRGAIIAAEVGAAKSTKKQRLEEDANKACDLIEDPMFWVGLETVIGDLEPICYGTNINQKDSTRADQVLITLIGMYLHFADHPEPGVASAMCKRLEKRWKQCDQPLFILALILNPFEGLSCFGPNANLNHFKCVNLIIHMYRRMVDRPDNLDTPEQRIVKEREVSKAFVQYLSGTGVFASWRQERAEWELNNGPDPVLTWEAFAGSKEVTELARFAILLFAIIVNQAGCERVFSDMKIKQTQRRNRLKLPKLEKMTKVGANILSENKDAGLVKERSKRKVHKSTETLLAVPRYRDLLEDLEDEDESERGRLLVSTPAGWRTEMARWVGDTREAERREAELDSDDAESDSDDDDVTRIRTTAWPSSKLSDLFGGQGPLAPEVVERRARASRTVLDEEALLMEALAEAEEDERLDDGAMAGSEDEYEG